MLLDEKERVLVREAAPRIVAAEAPSSDTRAPGASVAAAQSAVRRRRGLRLGRRLLGRRGLGRGSS
jgi:hypothetical protein